MVITKVPDCLCHTVVTVAYQKCKHYCHLPDKLSFLNNNQPSTIASNFFVPNSVGRRILHTVHSVSEILIFNAHALSRVIMRLLPTVVLRYRWERKKVPHIWVVPNGTSTFSVLENQINEIFKLGLFEAAKAEGGRLVKEADFEAEKKIPTKKI